MNVSRGVVEPDPFAIDKVADSAFAVH